VADHSSHAHHDRFAIAAAVGGGSAPATIRTCPACGALYADLDDLREAIRRAWTPIRVRDLRLSAADGVRLRPRRWRSILSSIGSARDSVTKPLAIGFTTLGLAGLLLTTVPASSLAPAPAAARESGSGAVIAAAPGAAGPSAAGSQDPTGSPPVDTFTTGPSSETPLPDRSTAAALLSIGFLTLGVGLFGLRRSGRRGRVR
jgi:anti-sigma factor RsiW